MGIRSFPQLGLMHSSPPAVPEPRAGDIHLNADYDWAVPLAILLRHCTRSDMHWDWSGQHNRRYELALLRPVVASR